MVTSNVTTASYSNPTSLIVLPPLSVVNEIDNNTALIQFNKNTSNSNMKTPVHLSNSVIRAPKPIHTFTKRPIATNMCICSYNKKRFFPWKKAMELMHLDSLLRNENNAKQKRNTFSSGSSSIILRDNTPLTASRKRKQKY